MNQEKMLESLITATVKLTQTAVPQLEEKYFHNESVSSQFPTKL